MTFPVAPVQNNIIEESKTPLSVSWLTYHNQLSVQLRSKFSDQGYVFPGVGTENLDNIASTKVKSVVYNEDTSRMNVNNSGSYEEIATRPRNTTTEISTIITSEGVNAIGRIFVDTDTNTLVTTLDGINPVTLQTV